MPPVFESYCDMREVAARGRAAWTEARPADTPTRCRQLTETVSSGCCRRQVLPQHTYLPMNQKYLFTDKLKYLPLDRSVFVVPDEEMLPCAVTAVGGPGV